MKKFLKHKFSKRLLNLLNFRRNGFLRNPKRLGQDSTTTSFTNIIRPFTRGGDFQDKSLAVGLARLNQVTTGSSSTSVPNINEQLRLNTGTGAKASDLISSMFSLPPRRFEIEVSNASISDKLRGNSNDNLIVAILKKKKFALRSFLYSAVCKFPRKSIFDTLGEERPRKYFTIPYRLSFSGFICNKTLKGYYNNLSHKVLFSLHKKIKIRAKKSDKLAEPFDLKTGPGARLLTLPQQKKEIAKDLVLNLESRLDSSVLRLLQFKSLYTIKQSKQQGFGSYSNYDASSSVPGRSGFKLSNYKVKAP